jgi:multicomponent Na+:H+ antiporter subunit E
MNLGLILFGFWLAITGSFHWQSLLTGAIISFFVAYFNRYTAFSSRELSNIDFAKLYIFLIYIIILIGDIVVANLQVANIVLRKDMKIEPTIITVKSPVKSPPYKALFANSITLTPGTLTLDLVDDDIVVHCLTKEIAHGFLDWNMFKYIKLLEGDTNV